MELRLASRQQHYFEPALLPFGDRGSVDLRDLRLAAVTSRVP
jgi:hypothetical protein